ncbi:MAG: hypothetical protein H6747_15995 [Deltaproteobacteria bacterium]|nr:hypothetical protein [Deltaproteobacteria bacterium]
MMRTSKYNIITAPTSVPAALLVPPSAVRVAILVSAMSDETLFITPDPNAAVLTGFQITKESGPLLLKREDLGDIITAAWYATATTTPQLVPVLDISDSAWSDR